MFFLGPFIFSGARVSTDCLTSTFDYVLEDQSLSIIIETSDFEDGHYLLRWKDCQIIVNFLRLKKVITLFYILGGMDL